MLSVIIIISEIRANSVFLLSIQNNMVISINLGSTQECTYSIVPLTNYLHKVYLTKRLLHYIMFYYLYFQ